MPAFPPNWYQYEFPLPKVPNAPVPSQANYSPENCAWLIEMFASILGTSHTDLRLRYENNTPNDRFDDIFVEHPDDKLYYNEEAQCKPKSPELDYYEKKAKKSKILELFETYSPKGEDENFLEYFQDLGCGRYFTLSFSLLPLEIIDVTNYAGYLDDAPDTLNVNKIREPVYAHDGDASHLRNTAPSANIEFAFENLPDDAPELYSSVAVKWVDTGIYGTGTSAGVTGKIPGAEKTEYYDTTTGYAFRQITWAERNFTREEVNDFTFSYHDGLNPLSLPVKKLTAVELVVTAVD